MAEVFLMEDSAPLRRVLVEELRGAGHNVTAFPDGTEAQDVPFLGNADVLVTDLEMPKFDGNDVIAVARKTYPDLPIIVITGKEPETIGPLPVNRIMRKPVTGHDLANEIEALTIVA